MMRGKTWSTTTLVAVLCLLSVCVLIRAECPNGCSGYGDCQSKDMCKCYKNYQGNDCGDRTCPFGRAHVDTPKGDINMDKDRLTAGFILEGSQQAPSKTYEYFSPDAAADEAHFYMECSNKGICDRSTGLCQCFDGYEGTGCRRTTCPGKCNGHGTCESIRELGVKAAGTLFGRKGAAGAVSYDLWDGNSTYGCRCDPWYHGPDCEKRSCKVGVDPLFLGRGVPTFETFIVHAGAATIPSGTALDPLAWIRLRLFDYHGESYITKKIFVTGTAATDVAAVTAAIKGVPNLTFAKVTCAPQGTDPLTGFLSVRTALGSGVGATQGMSVVCQYSDNPGKIRIPEIADSGNFGDSTNTPFVKVTTTTQQGFDDEWFTVMSADLTDTVAGNSMSINTKAPSTLTDAYQLVKIDDNIVLVKSVGSGSSVLALEYGMKHAISGSTPVFTAPAGLLTITTDGPITDAAINVGDDAFKFAGAATDPAPYVAGDLLIFHNQFFYVQQVYYSNAKWTVQLDKPFGGDSVEGKLVATGAKVHRVIVGPITLSDGRAISANAVDQATTFKFAGSATDSAPCLPGDLITFRSQFFRVHQAVKTSVTVTGTPDVTTYTWTVTVNKKFTTVAPVTFGPTEIVSKVTVGSDKTMVYKYVSECSGRGMCNYETGICACFKGYTDDNCDTQNILAV